MKKLLLVSVLFLLLSVVTPVYAGSVDGLWAMILPDQSLNSFMMLRENAGVLLVTKMNLEYDWEAFYGQFDGTTSNLTTLVSKWEQYGLTCTFLSPDSASCAVTSCTSTASSQCEAGVIGFAFTLQKLL